MNSVLMCAFDETIEQCFLLGGISIVRVTTDSLELKDVGFTYWFGHCAVEDGSTLGLKFVYEPTRHNHSG